MNEPSDPHSFRQILSLYPTGVCVITGSEADGRNVGMTIGSFVSVSLDPPLIGFFPMKTSQAWSSIAASGRFCVNLLGDDQEGLCRRFASRGDDKFDGLSVRSSPGGCPILEGCLAWLDCSVFAVNEAGDHFAVFGRVEAMEATPRRGPLLFFQGGYGSFASPTLTAEDPLGELIGPLRCADIVRPLMTRLAEDLSSTCLAIARLRNSIITVATTTFRQSRSTPIIVGEHIPLIPPVGAAFIAWDGPTDIERWIAALSQPAKEQCRSTLAAIRAAGYAVSMIDTAHKDLVHAIAGAARSGDTESDLKLATLAKRIAWPHVDIGQEGLAGDLLLSVPIFDARGAICVMLCVTVPEASLGAIDDYLGALKRTAAEAQRVTKRDLSL